jgi:hypothetical protein
MRPISHFHEMWRAIFAMAGCLVDLSAIVQMLVQPAHSHATSLGESLYLVEMRPKRSGPAEADLVIDMVPLLLVARVGKVNPLAGQVHHEETGAAVWLESSLAPAVPSMKEETEDRWDYELRNQPGHQTNQRGLTSRWMGTMPATMELQTKMKFLLQIEIDSDQEEDEHFLPLIESSKMEERPGQ